MATNITYKFSNNFENEKSSVAVTVPAMIEQAAQRGAVDAVYIKADEVYTSTSIPANAVISNMYLVVEDVMVGDVTVTVGGTAVFTDASVGTVGATASAIVTPALPLYTTTPSDVTFVFSALQDAGSIKLAFDFIQLDTNTAKYVGR